MIKTIKCLIVDDEPAAHYVLTNYIGQNKALQLVQQCYNAVEAMNYLRANKVDLMFLDIDMPEVTGLELLQTLKDPPITILTTAYSEFALESYEYGVIDYLLKPIYLPRFLRAVERVFTASAPRKVLSSSDSIALKIDGSLINIPLNDILFAQSYGNYVKVFTPGRTYLATITTNLLESSLPAEFFLRVHKSYVIALNKIDNTDRDTLIIKGEQIPVGITYRRELAERLRSIK